MSRNFFQECETFKWNDIDWKNYFFAEVSALAYHDGTRAKRELNKIGITTYLRSKENQKQKVEFIWGSS